MCMYDIIIIGAGVVGAASILGGAACTTAIGVSYLAGIHGLFLKKLIQE